MKKLNLILYFLGIGFVACSPKILTPMEVSKEIFSKEEFKEINKHSVGEYHARPTSQDFPDYLEYQFRSIFQNEKTAVINVTIIDSLKGHSMDTYLHFVKDTLWKVEAFRSLAMTNFFYQIKAEMESLSISQIDSVIITNRGNTEDWSPYKSRQDFDQYLHNVNLIIALDDTIIQHFKNNEKEFNRIKTICVNRRKEEPKDGLDFKFLEKDYKKLGITSVGYSDYELNNCLRFNIGGILDNQVGFIFVGQKDTLPKMSPSPIILIREIGEGWYLYKTT